MEGDVIFQKNKGEKYILISKFERNFNSDMQLPDYFFWEHGASE